MVRARMDEKWDRILEEFENVYPSVASETNWWYVVGLNEIVVILDDGSRFIYNYMTKMLKQFYSPGEVDEQNEEECRREFSRNLRKKMEDAYMTQEMLSEATGISKVTISKYMNGLATPSIYNARRICKALNCATYELF